MECRERAKWEDLQCRGRKERTSSPSLIGRRTTTSMRGLSDSANIYFAAALGTQEWLNSRLASGNTPWATETRCEWIAKLLFPKREYISSRMPSINTSLEPIGQIGGVRWSVMGPDIREEKVENDVGWSSTKRARGPSCVLLVKSSATRCESKRASSCWLEERAWKAGEAVNWLYFLHNFLWCAFHCFSWPTLAWFSRMN